jgi:hypothetical protein
MGSDEAREAAAAEKEAAAAQKEATAARRAYILALAGAVVAIVGVVVGAGSAWLISREDRSNQRALARETRAYDRRAAAYLDALSLFLAVQQPLGQTIQASEKKAGRTTKYPPEPVFPSRKVSKEMLGRLDSEDSRLPPALVAFASRDALTAYQDGWSAARKAFQDADEVWYFFPPGLDTKAKHLALAERPVSAGSRQEFLIVQSRYKRDTQMFRSGLASFTDATRQDIG